MVSPCGLALSAPRDMTLLLGLPQPWLGLSPEMGAAASHAEEVVTGVGRAQAHRGSGRESSWPPPGALVGVGVLVPQRPKVLGAPEGCQQGRESPYPQGLPPPFPFLPTPFSLLPCTHLPLHALFSLFPFLCFPLCYICFSSFPQGLLILFPH